jgi:pseudaminic acid cytidylyltransferase
MNICVIPARKGSKRIPGKNVKMFSGKPIIAWSVLNAMEARVFDKIVISTDCKDTFSLAANFGPVEFLCRPPELADDFSTTREVICHAIEQYPEACRICCLYPAAPLVLPSDLILGLELIRDRGWDFAFPVGKFEHPVDRALTIDPDGELKNVESSRYHDRTQDLEDLYFDAGSFYWGDAVAWQTYSNPYDGQVAPIVLPRLRVRDIDEPEDWKEAEILFRFFKSGPPICNAP